VDWIHLAQVRIQWWDLVNLVMNVSVSYDGNLVTS
jgi:hypothetical protein